MSMNRVRSSTASLTQVETNVNDTPANNPDKPAEDEDKKKRKKRFAAFLISSIAAACVVGGAAVGATAAATQSNAVTSVGYGSACNEKAICSNNTDCINGTCACSSGYFLYNNVCTQIGTYQVICTSNSTCDATKLLFCVTSQSQYCNCPTASSLDHCDCPIGYYWDYQQNTCLHKKDIYVSCVNTLDYQCKTNLGLVCTGSCGCLTTHYWNGSLCLPKKTYQQACSNSSECNDNVNLTCPNVSSNCNCPNNSIANVCDCVNTSFWDLTLNGCYPRLAYGATCVNGTTYQCVSGLNLICNGICTCPTTHYWTGTTCALLKTYAAACFNSTECDSSKNLTCSVTCTCPTTHYWTGSTCALLKSYTASCFNSTECDASKSLSCYATSNGCNCPTTSTNGMCDCATTSYWNGTTCVSRKAYGTTCTNPNTYECQFGKNLTCNGICTCPTTHYWTGTTCALLKSYAASCVNSTECDASKSLTCYNASNGCNCPTTSVANSCDCATNMYWNGASCVARKAYGATCTNPNTYQCLAGLNMTCTGTCTCPTTHYWNGSTCGLLKTYNQACFNNTECDPSKNYICNVNCTCPSGYYWSGSTCALLKTYAASCFNSTECDANKGLSCYATANGCNCPTTSTNGMCDCATSSYWDSTTSKCTPRKLNGTACSAAYQCLFNSNMICSTVCTCSSTTYFNGAACVPLLTYQQGCNSTTQCWFYGGLQCLNGKCDCSLPTSQSMYWMASTNSCQLLKTSCKLIKAANSSATSGVYYLDTSAGPLEAYCEMVLDGGGYTFLPWASLSAAPSMLNTVYTDKSRVLFRLQTRSNPNSQPYVVTTQISTYASDPISVQLSAHANYGGSWFSGGNAYSIPANAGNGPYIFIGMILASKSNLVGSTLGHTYNGQSSVFPNCDGNPNSYWALFANQNPPSPSSYCPGCESGSSIEAWKLSALPHPQGTYMPSNYFYWAEIHWGGCGGYIQSNYWPVYNGVSVGFR